MSQDRSKEKVKQRNTGHRSASSLKQFLDTNEIAARVRQNLGLEKIVERDQSGNVVQKKEQLADHAFMNEDGINSVMAKFRAVIDKNQSLSSYNSKEIQNLMMDEHENLARDLIQNWSRYEIKNRSQMDEIVAMVTNNEYSIYKRAEGGQTLEALADSTQEVSRTKTDVSTDDGKRGSRLPFIG
jgi:hypothetical protein